MDFIFALGGLIIFFFAIFAAFDLPVNNQGLRFREWWKQRPKWKDFF